MQPIYHIGFGRDGDRLLVYAVTDRDLLPADLWRYWGVRCISRRRLREVRHELLAAVNQTLGTRFARAKVVRQ
jgi:hypothetical protein